MYWYVLVHIGMYWYIPVHTRMYYSSIIFWGRYLGLFGDHIVPAVLHRYTQVLRREDPINSKGKSLVTAARLEAVWKRLSDRFCHSCGGQLYDHLVPLVRCPSPQNLH